MIMVKRNIVRLFELRKAHLDYRINRDYVRNGIATIPCRISGYNDIISPFSVTGCESLTPDFFDYLTASADVTPAECPLVLNIIGGSLSAEEKESIEKIVRDDLAYELGIVEKEEKRHTRTFILMFAGMLISGLLLWLTESMESPPRELLYILFWFMGESICDYIFLTGYELRKKRRLSGRLASIKVVFSDSYTAPNYTDKDVDQLYCEIEKDVNETLSSDK